MQNHFTISSIQFSYISHLAFLREEIKVIAAIEQHEGGRNVMVLHGGLVVVEQCQGVQVADQEVVVDAPIKE